MEPHIFCCDWGTSTLRLRLVEEESKKVIREIQTGEGVGRLYAAWQEDGAREESRQAYFLRILQTHIITLSTELDFPISHIPIVISGMASSSLGLRDIPYARLPFALDGRDVSAIHIGAELHFAHEVFLISGVRSDEDVIRGEEVEIVGLCSLPELASQIGDGESIIVLPGTHSKHIRIKDNHIVSFKTFMTGEFYGLLAERSILRDSLMVADHTAIVEAANQRAFLSGVATSADASLLHSSFRTRTNHLFGKLTKIENAFFLSGLLIGHELRDLGKQREVCNLVVCAGEKLFRQYTLACEALGYSNATYISSDRLEEATVAGQLKIYKQLIKQRSL